MILPICMTQRVAVYEEPSSSVRLKNEKKKKEGIGDAGRTADIRILWSAIRVGG